ncbi:MAG: hypothetical protein JXQ76_00625 [Campylobacterales bacterium]|nr:hypothetical protein [Campylobacterales bacterium]
METPTHQSPPQEHPTHIIWSGHQNYSTILKYYVVSLLMAVMTLYLSFAFNYLFLLLLIFPLALLAIKFIQTKKTIFEINDKRIIMKRFENNKYLTYEVELYDVKHIVEEEKASGKGHIIFKTTSSLFPEIKTPLMDNPTRIHDIVRDVIEEAKIERSTFLANKGKPKAAPKEPNPPEKS